MIVIFLLRVCALVLSFLQQIQRFLDVGHRALRQSNHLLIDDLQVHGSFAQQVVDLLIVDL